MDKPDAIPVPEINPKDIQWDDRPLTEQGAMSVVYGGSFDGHRVILKHPGTKGTFDKEDFLNELGHLMVLGHQNVVQIHGAVLSTVRGRPDWWLVIEFCERGTLTRALGLAHTTKPKISVLQKFQCAIDIANGMNWMHKRPVVHRDLKNDNIFVTTDWVCKVGDLGFSHALPERSTKFSVAEHGDQGSVLYQAPEMLQIKYLGGNQSENVLESKLDVWAFGLMLWEIFTQDLVFNQYDDAAVYAHDIVVKKVRPPSSKLIPAVIQELIDMCLQDPPEDRPTFALLKERLENARIQHFVGFDKDAETFWTHNWPTKGKVDWNTRDKNSFMRALCRRYSWPYDQSTEFFDVIGRFPLHVNEYVTLETFQSMLYWFGPLGDPEGDPEDCLLVKLQNLCFTDWFWGPVSFDDAGNALAKQKPGTFLVRMNLGGTKPICDCPFVITYVTIKHELKDIRVWIRGNGTGFIVEDGKDKTKVNTRSIVDLIAKIRLEYPEKFKWICPGSPVRSRLEKTTIVSRYFGQSSRPKE